MCYNVNKICKHSPPLSKKPPGKRTSKAKQNKRKKHPKPMKCIPFHAVLNGL